MKRITQILASILFIITILTIYLAFDFAINTAVSNRYSNDKHDHHEHIHNDMKLKRISMLSLPKIKTINQTLKYNNNDDDDEHNYINDQEHRIHSLKKKQYRIKSAQFHKSKTGIKINQLRKSVKDQQKHLLTTKIVKRKNIKLKNDKFHV